MKVQILQEELQKAFNVVTRGVPSKNQMPILNQVLVEATDDGLVLTGTNLEMGVRVKCGGKVIETGSLAVPGKTVTEYVSTLPSGMVTIEVQNEKMKFLSGGFSATFAGMPANDYPVVATLGDGAGVKVDRELFLQIASMVVFAAGVDETRPVLTGIKFDTKDGMLRVCATDGFRLSRKLVDAKNNESLQGLIIPARSVSELAKMLSEGKKSDLVVSFEKGSGQVVFGYDRFEMVTRVIEGNFPDVERIIPKDQTTRLVVNREDVASAIKAVSVFARENNNIVRFSVVDQYMTIQTSGTQTGEGAVKVEIEKKGEDMEMLFNYRYVMDFLSAIKTDRVEIILNGSSVAGLFVPEEDKEFIYLVMPVRM